MDCLTDQSRYQFDRQPIQQLGMRGGLALVAEILGRADDPAAEQRGPMLIDRYPADQRIPG